MPARGTHASASAQRGLSLLAAGITRGTRLLARGISAPFRGTRSPHDHRIDLGVNLTFASFQDIMFFAAVLGIIIVVVAVFAVFHAEDTHTPLPAALLKVALICATWAISAVFLRFLFDRPLGRAASSVISYVIAVFLALAVAAVLFG
jgi:hypothetical protein